MSLNEGWWDRPHTRHDIRQNEAIESLRRTLGAQAGSARREAKAAQQATDRVAGELARLEERLDGFIELTDLRFQLLDHHETTRVRNELNRRLSLLSRGGTAPERPLDDIPGYWLPPAANLVLGALGGQEPVRLNEVLDIARERDRFRTELFVLAAGVGFEAAGLTEPVIVSLLNNATTPDTADTVLTTQTRICRAWRQLWIDTASGGFGAQAAEVLAKRLAGAVSDLEMAEQLGTALSSATSPLTDLRRLRERCQKVLATTGTPAVGASDTEIWRDFLRELVGEGHAEEAELKERAGRLLKKLAGPTEPTPEAMWTDQGSLAENLCNDILDPATPDAQAALAMRCGADAIMLCAQRLWDRTHGYVPEERTVQVEGLDIQVTTQGVAPRDRERIAQRILVKYPVVENQVRNWGIGSAALVVVSVGFFVGGVPALGVVALVALFACLVKLGTVAQEPRKLAELHQMHQDAADKRLERAHAAIVAAGRDIPGTSQQAAGERDTIHRLLGPYARRG